MKNPTENIETLKGLINHYSPSGKEKHAVIWLLSRMQTLGFSDVFQDEVGNAIGVLGHGSQQIVLLGHIDTVPGEITVREEGGRLYGRGSVDAKGPLACFVDAVASIGERKGTQTIVIGAIEEERNSVGARFVVDKYRPDYLIVGEPSGWDKITLGYKGISVFEISIQLDNTHSAGSERNACETVLKTWEAIKSFADEFNRGKSVFDQISPNLTGMTSRDEDYSNWAQLVISTRLPLNLSPDEWVTHVGQLSKGIGVTIKPSGNPISAYRAKKNSSLVRAFLRSVRKHGGKPGFSVKTGTADLNIVAPVWNCPAVVYGPGDSSLDHTPGENIMVSEYLKSVGILRDVLIQIIGN